jgi:hypothetical protein
MADIPSASITTFHQSTALTGWTKITTYNDYALRVTTGTVSTGGFTNFSSVFTSLTPTGSVGGTATIGDTTLDSTMIPSHTHTGSRQSSPAAMPSGGAITSNPAGGLVAIRPPAIAYTTYTSGSSGGGGSHNHTQPLTFDSTPGFSGNALNMSIKYVDCIIAQRN